MTKKRLVLVILIFLVIFISLIIWAIYLSFAVVRPTTEEINKKLASLVFSKIVRIPVGIQRPSYEFGQTRYFWEMETNQKEVTGVNFTYNPAFTKTEDRIIASLEMPQNGDPSIFTKVLPAIVSDDQSLKSAQEPNTPNLSGSLLAGYTKIELSQDVKNNQTTKIVWTYEKSKIPEEIKKLYAKLNYPPKILKILDSIPGFLINLARG